MKLKIQAFAIVMLLFGNPIIHFFRDYAGVLPKSALIMPIFSVIFFGMIFISMENFKKLNKPNFNISVLAWCFLGYSIFAMTITDYNRKVLIEVLNYLFLFIYFVLLCAVPKKVAYVIIPIVILVALFDNFALVYAFIRNPFTHLGERAIISDTGWGQGAGNPSLYSFMAFTGFIASVIYFKGASVLWKIICIGTALSSIAVILMTMIRATMITLVLCTIFYFFMNYKNIIKKNNIGPWYNYAFQKNNFILFSCFIVVGIIVLLMLNPKIINNLLVYVNNSTTTLTHVLETIFKKSEGKGYVDPSAANRLGTFSYATRLLSESPIKILYGFGYRFLYVDIPIVQVLLEEGIIGLSIILMFHYFVSKNVLLAAQVANNQWILLLVYYYILLLMNTVSRGEPYDPYFWNYFLTIARFMKPEDMILGTKKVESRMGLSPSIN
jgi:hypothetical protein